MTTDLKKLCKILYAALAATAIMQFSFYTILIGAIAMVITVYIAHEKRKNLPFGNPYATHLTWIIRTFWIGGGVYLPILTLVECGILMTKIDMAEIQQKMISQEITSPHDIQTMFMTQYSGLMVVTTLIFTLPFLAWWLWRCWSGYKQLEQDQPVKNSMSWL
jgi:uncharacterized membrane protein